MSSTSSSNSHFSLSSTFLLVLYRCHSTSFLLLLHYLTIRYFDKYHFFFFFPRLIQFSQRWFNHNIKSNRFSIHNRFDYSLVFWEYSLLIFSLVLFKNRCKTFSLLHGDVNQTFLALKANMARMINFLSSSLWSFFNASSMLLFRKLFFSFEKLIKILHHRICMQQHRLLISLPC